MAAAARGPWTRPLQEPLLPLQLLPPGALASAAETEAEVDETNLGISLMLLGSISFIMGTFYMVNHPDPDMQLYSWKVISSTISIFSSVLLFQGVEGVMKAYFISFTGDSPLFLDAVHMLLWFLTMQFVLAVISGAVGRRPRRPEGLLMNMETFARLMGHITGFSAIQAWGTLQQLLVHHLSFGSPLVKHVLAIGSVPLTVVGMYYLIRSTDRLRDCIALRDQELDAYEIIWDEKTKETENDVMSLTVSFLLVQVLRFFVGGTLPNQEGGEPPALHNDSQVLGLLGIGAVFAVLAAWVKRKVKSHHRLHTISKIVWAMCFAWCTFYGFSWWLTSAVLVEEHDAIVAVVLALINTAIAFSLIRVLDFLADLEATDESVDMSILAVIEALGILVGFSWEQAFDEAVGSIAEKANFLPPAACKLGLAVLLCALVCPAWRFYILPLELGLAEELEHRTALDISRDSSGLITTSGRAQSIPLAGVADEALERKRRRREMKKRAKLARNSLVVCSKLRALKQQQAETKQEAKQLGRRIEEKAEELRAMARKGSFLWRWGTLGSLREHLKPEEEHSTDGTGTASCEGSPLRSLCQPVDGFGGGLGRALSGGSSVSSPGHDVKALQQALAQRDLEIERLRAHRVAELEGQVRALEQAAREREHCLAKAQGEARAYAAELEKAVRLAERFAKVRGGQLTTHGNSS